MALVVTLYFSPFLIENPDFFIGFAFCFSLFIIVFLLLHLISYFSKTHRVESSPKWLVALMAILLLSLLFAYVIQRNKKEKRDFEKQALISNSLKIELISAEKNTALLPLWLDMKAKLLSVNVAESDSLSIELIDEIADLSHNYIPYQSYISDKLTLSSPERGKLLLDLLKLDIDSVSFHKILNQATFAYASLPHANLEGRALNGINFTGANLRKAKLASAELNKAQLENADLWSADLSGAQLSDALLTKANLEWSKLIGAEFNNAQLDGSTLSNAIGTKASFRKASVQQAKLVATKLDSCDLHGVNFYESDLSRSSLKSAALSTANLRNSLWTDAILAKANLTNSVLRGISLERTDLTEVTLDSVFVRGADWYEKLSAWQVKGGEEITKKYLLKEEPSFPDNFVLKHK